MRQQSIAQTVQDVIQSWDGYWCVEATVREGLAEEDQRRILAVAGGDEQRAAAIRTALLTECRRRVEEARTSITRSSAKINRSCMTYYEAVAQYRGKDAGIVCSALTKNACRALAQKQTTLDVRIRRVVSTPEAIAGLKAVGKL